MLHLLPSRLGRPQNDLIFALNADASRRKKAGEPVINATLGSLLDEDGALAVLPSAARAVHEVPQNEWAAYAPIAGSPEFLEAVRKDVFGAERAFLDASLAVATPGGTGAIRHALTNYLASGQAALVPSYFWGPYQTLADEHERSLETFPMFGAQGRFDVASLETKLAGQLDRQGRALVLLNDPCNNPTGYSLGADEWSAVVEVLLAQAGRPVTLLVDMAYWLYGRAEPRSFLKALRPLLGKVGLLFAWSASKSFTQYGLRVGALLACVADEKDRAQTAAALTQSCRGAWSNCVRGGMHAVTRLLTDEALAGSCDAERAKLKALLEARVEAFNAMAKPRGLHYPRYEGGFFVTVFHPQAEAKASRLREQGVFVVPQKGALRVALCSVPLRDVGRLVDALAD